MPALAVDLSRFTSEGFGTVYGTGAGELTLGQIIAVTDDEADVLEATVRGVRPGAADLQVHWDRVRRQP